MHAPGRSCIVNRQNAFERTIQQSATRICAMEKGRFRNDWYRVARPLQWSPHDPSVGFSAGESGISGE